LFLVFHVFSFSFRLCWASHHGSVVPLLWFCDRNTTCWLIFDIDYPLLRADKVSWDVKIPGHYHGYCCL
jgi:hypothetical protein